MTRMQGQLARMGLISAIITLAMSIGTAQAGHNHRAYCELDHRHHGGCGYAAVKTAGWITIDGRKTQIISGRDMQGQIVGAFRRAGYRAWIHGGSVRVDYGSCKPRVRWHAEGYTVRFRWGWNDLGLSLHRASRSYSKPLRVVRPVRPVRPVYRFGTCW